MSGEVGNPGFGHEDSQTCPSGSVHAGPLPGRRRGLGHRAGRDPRRPGHRQFRLRPRRAPDQSGQRRGRRRPIPAPGRVRGHPADRPRQGRLGGGAQELHTRRVRRRPRPRVLRGPRRREGRHQLSDPRRRHPRLRRRHRLRGGAARPGHAFGERRDAAEGRDPRRLPKQPVPGRHAPQRRHARDRPGPGQAARSRGGRHAGGLRRRGRVHRRGRGGRQQPVRHRPGAPSRRPRRRHSHHVRPCPRRRARRHRHATGTGGL